MSSAFNEDFDELQRESTLDESSKSTDEYPQSAQLSEKYQAANDEIRRAIGLGEFIISAEAVAELRRFRRELNKDYDSYFDYLIGSMNAIRDCLEHMRNIAREDLKGGWGHLSGRWVVFWRGPSVLC
jgi:hypothetical protein